MRSDKFDEIDRDPVIRTVSKHLNARLRRVGNYHKWLRDDSGRDYWILGGRDRWHGISEEMMNAQLAAHSDGQLVFAAREKQYIVIYAGPTAPLVAARHMLPRASKSSNDYQFTCTSRGAHLFIDQVPSESLSKLAELPFDERDRESSARTRKARKLLSTLSPTDRDELLRRLRDEV